MKLETLIKVAQELQEICEFEPAIKTKGKSEEDLKKVIAEAAESLTPEDKLSKDAIALFKEMKITVGGGAAEEEEEEEEEEAPVKPAKAAKTPAKAKEEEEEEEEEEKPAKKEKAVKEPKPKKEKKEKKEKGPTIAQFIDECLLAGGKFEDMAVKVTEESGNRGTARTYKVGAIRSHLAFRVKSNPEFLTSKGLVETEDGVKKAGKK
jgi:outer membrane biosynthesis protein TonB